MMQERTRRTHALAAVAAPERKPPVRLRGRGEHVQYLTRALRPRDRVPDQIHRRRTTPEPLHLPKPPGELWPEQRRELLIRQRRPRIVVKIKSGSGHLR